MCSGLLSSLTQPGVAWVDRIDDGWIMSNYSRGTFVLSVVGSPHQSGLGEIPGDSLAAFSSYRDLGTVTIRQV